MIHSPKIRSTVCGGLLCLGAGLAASSHAITPIGAAVRGAPSVPTAPSTAPVAVAPSLDLIAGTIGAVDVASGSLTVGSAALQLHPTRLRIFGANGAVRAVSDLRPGTPIRFALEPGVTDARRVVLIYLDGRS